jgi:hypothetical protein
MKTSRKAPAVVPTPLKPPVWAGVKRGSDNAGSLAIETADAALSLVRRRGILLEAARGPLPNFADAVIGEHRGGWWGHPEGRRLFWLTRAVRRAPDVLVCRLVDGKITYVHRRLWPALVRLASTLPRSSIAAIREIHTAAGKHVVKETPFPRWVPPRVFVDARRLTMRQASAALGISVNRR